MAALGLRKIDQKSEYLSKVLRAFGQLHQAIYKPTEDRNPQCSFFAQKPPRSQVIFEERN